MVSIIIVNYKVEEELIACISSIFKSKPKVKFEVIVVDNDNESQLGKTLVKNFSQVKYIKSKGNIGFGAGNNLGAKLATGDYLFFLNPDTVIENNSIDILTNFVKNNPNSGMVAPLLYDLHGNVYLSQGSSSYDLKSAIVINSFINKLFPTNSISKKFFHSEWNKGDVEEFDVVPGTAFMIKKNLFEKIGMFDENFFLYFEEYDLAMNIKKLGYKNYIIPKAKVIHIWEASTKKTRNIEKIFSESRFNFFKKHYGRGFAFIVNIASCIGKYELMLSAVLVGSIYLGLLKIRESMIFIGDQGWFYLSARDMLVNGQIPLVGIASSHTWLHQGPFWTYLLALFMWLFRFDPISGAYLTVIFGVLSVFGIYIVGSTLFSKRVGLIASILYATTPLTVYYMKFPYHTSPIPLFVIMLIFYLHKIVQDKFNYLPLAVLLLTVLYNFEIATVALWGVLISILIYKIFKNKKNFWQIINKKNIVYSLFSIIIPMSPMILYDVRNGFPQTLKFAAWSAYRVILLFGYNPEQSFSMNKIIIMFNYLFDNFIKLIFVQNDYFSFVILIFLILWVIYLLFKKKKVSSYTLVVLLLIIPLIFIIFNQTPSGAYLPILLPTTILLISLFADFALRKRMIFIPAFIILIFLVIGNINHMIKNNFVYGGSGKLFTLDKRIQAAHEILDMAQKKDYNLKGIGLGSEFESFTTNYEYLTWWLGHGPSKKNVKTKIFVSESATGIKISK